MRTTTFHTYRVFWQHARMYKFSLFLIVGAVIGSGIGRIIIPLFYKRFFDTVFAAETGDPAVVATLTGIIFVVLAIECSGWLFHRIEELSLSFFQPRVTTDLANTCFQYLHRHSYGFFTGHFVGALVRRVNRLTDAFEGISDRMFGDILPIAVRMLAMLFVLLARNATLAIFLFAWMTAYLLINYALTMYKLRYDRQAAQINSLVTAELADTITNNVSIKAFSALQDEQKSFHAVTDRQFRMWRFTQRLDSGINGVQGGLMIGIEIAMFYMAIRFWNQGLLSIGDFALLQAYLIQVFERLWGFGRVIRRTYKHLADAEEMVDILHTPHEIIDKPGAKPLLVKKTAVEFRNVSFYYHHTRPVLKDFTLVIPQGQKVGVVGLSGAGKSTLASLLLRLYDVAGGAIFVDNQNIADVTQDSLRAHIAYIPQEPVLFHRTLKENIHYGKRDASDDDVIRAARLAHSADFIEQLPDMYDTYVGERGIRLSGGERQRVAIARAILKDAPILVLDEATSSLDSEAERAIQQALENLMRGRTALVIAHRLSTIMRLDRIVVIDQGSVVEDGTHDELLKNPDGMYKKLWTLQAGGFIP